MHCTEDFSRQWDFFYAENPGNDAQAPRVEVNWTDTKVCWGLGGQQNILHMPEVCRKHAGKQHITAVAGLLLSFVTGLCIEVALIVEGCKGRVVLTTTFIMSQRSELFSL